MGRRSKSDQNYVAFGFIIILIFGLLKTYPWVIELALVIGAIVLILYVASKGTSKKFQPYDMTQIDRMDPFKFEDYICDLYKNLGYKKSYTTQKSGDFGADVIAQNDYEKIAIQVKHYAKNNVTGLKAIQEVIASKSFYHANKCVVITTSYFSKAAKSLAISNNVQLIDREELSKILQQQKSPTN